MLRYWINGLNRWCRLGCRTGMRRVATMMIHSQMDGWMEKWHTRVFTSSAQYKLYVEICIHHLVLAPEGLVFATSGDQDEKGGHPLKLMGLQTASSHMARY